MRFGLTQVKLFIATIVLNYKIVCTNKTPKQIKFNEMYLLAGSADQLLMQFEKRTA